MKTKLKKDFYNRNVITVAKELLGKIFVYENNNFNKKLIGRIVETEAYEGKTDEAAHTYNGKTKRNEIMFEEGGFLYVYFTYGIHYCMNVVTGKKNEGNAVLLRAMEPIEGKDIFSENRFGVGEKINEQIKNLLNGPAKICKAFEITKEQNGKSLLGNEIYILDAPTISEHDIVETTRIGIRKSAELPWRFYLKDNEFVSKK